MSTRYSAAEVRGIVDQINIEAKMAGLVPMDAFMSYHPGNSENGISGHVECFRKDEDGYHMIRVDFLPEFTYKMTKTDHARLLGATRNVFFALRRMKDENERAARIEARLTDETGE